GSSGWSHLSGELNKSLGLMGFVEDTRITRADCARVRLHAQNRYYEDSFKLAQLLLFGNRFEYESGDYNISGFFLDMNDLFERFIMGLLKQRGYEVDYQHSLKYRVDESDKLMKPDYLIRSGDRDIVGDAKYKEIFEADTRSDEETVEETVEETDFGGVKVKVYHSDIYQLVAYLDNAGVDEGVLFYPAMRPVNTKTVSGFGGKTIRIWGVDLSNVGGLGIGYSGVPE
ncbi:MAG: hypothetical protein GY771_17120, partial [bacterium]|nr:hypothetical protein [bacterium]